MDTLRLFTAVEPPTAVRDQLLAVRAALPDLRWTAPENLHLTLRFIGETPAARLPAIKAALSNVRATRFCLRLKGLGLFARSYHKVLWAGVDEQAALPALKHSIDLALAQGAGLSPSGGRFAPHITLARLKGPVSGELRQFVQAHNALVTPEFTVAAFTLFSSVLTPGKAVHTAEQVYTLD